MVSNSAPKPLSEQFFAKVTIRILPFLRVKPDFSPIETNTYY